VVCGIKDGTKTAMDVIQLLWKYCAASIFKALKFETFRTLLSNTLYII